MTDKHLQLVRGFVKSPAESGRVAHVRVKDSNSKHHGQVMQVSSTCDGKTHWLVQGLNVNFQVGYKDGQGGEKIPYAVNVHLADEE